MKRMSAWIPRGSAQTVHLLHPTKDSLGSSSKSVENGRPLGTTGMASRAGTLHTEAVGRKLSADHEVKTEIPANIASRSSMLAMRQDAGRCKRRRGRVLRFGAGCVAFVLLLTLAGAVYQAIAIRRDRRKHPPPGVMVDVGGYRLHLHCMGQGSPTVVLVGGVGASTLNWALVQPEAAKITRVCGYDRAGVGWSDPGPRERSSRYAAPQLRRLLRNAAIVPPYILVGHSLGGFHVRVYASMYPQEVAGLVLVDSAISEEWLGATPDQFDKESRATAQLAATQDRYSRLGAWAIRLGAGRVYYELLRGRSGPGCLDQNFPPDVQDACIALINQPKWFEAGGPETAALLQSAIDAKQASIPGNVPLAVLVAGKDLSWQARKPDDPWFQYQKALTAGSTNSLLLVAARSPHYIPTYQPELVIEAIRKVVESARTGKPL